MEMLLNDTSVLLNRSQASRSYAGGAADLVRQGRSQNRSQGGAVVQMIPEMVSLREASNRTGVSYDCLRKLCLNHKIVHIRAGTKFLINFGRLVEYLDAAMGEDETQID